MAKPRQGLAFVVALLLLTSCHREMTYQQVSKYYARQARQVDKELQKRAKKTKPVTP